MQLQEQDRTFIASRVAALEARTGAQVLVAAVGKSDSYPEAPWKAFALGSAAMALACVAWQAGAGNWAAAGSRFGHALAMLAAGALLALLAVLCPGFARLFTDRTRREVETSQFAQSLFYRHGLDRTRGRTGILLLVSLFERRVVVLADAGFDGRVGAADWQALTARMTFILGRGAVAGALRAGLDALEALLLERGFADGAGGTMPPAVVLDIAEAG
ncbi:MAG TPA: TPM domain-containing protein [Burkholderiales bacterium]|nr:TPM domain-containing protein [Burkholderiales bacterium]